jgi:hypothetical protein
MSAAVLNFPAAVTCQSCGRACGEDELSDGRRLRPDPLVLLRRLYEVSAWGGVFRLQADLLACFTAKSDFLASRCHNGIAKGTDQPFRYFRIGRPPDGRAVRVSA